MREKERDMELILASGSPRRRELLSLYTTARGEGGFGSTGK